MTSWNLMGVKNNYCTSQLNISQLGAALAVVQSNQGPLLQASNAEQQLEALLEFENP